MKEFVTDHRANWVDKGRIPCLDALRVMAITMVLISHLGGGEGYIRDLASIGHLGVTLFFTLSGFLITLLLLRENEKIGRISLRSFYYRRILRIFPAYYAYLLIGLTVTFFGTFAMHQGYWVSAFTYMICYQHSMDNSWPLLHFWSLAVEEHFYLLWPLILVVFKPERALKIIFAYLLCTPLIRYGIWSFQRDWLDIDFCSITQMSSIAQGCLLAFIVRGDALTGLGAYLKRYPAGTVGVGIALLVIDRAARISGKFSILLSDPLSALACCMIMGGVLYIQNETVIRLLNNRVIVYLGALSYSLYIWQQPFCSGGVIGSLSITLKVLGIFACALVSFYIVERPFLKMKARAELQIVEGGRMT